MKSVLFIYCVVALVALLFDIDVGGSVTSYAILDWVVGAGSLLGSVASGLFGSSSQKSANETNLQIARENRDWQTGENQLNRDWQEKMWNMENLYNTPSAMRRRLEQAGYNPNALFSDMSAQRGANVGSPAMVGAPNGAHVEPVNPLSGLSGLGSALQLGMQSKLINAESANQSAQAQATIIKALSQAYQELGKDGFKAFASRVQPYMLSVNPDKSFWSERMKSEIYNLDMRSIQVELETSLSKRFTPQQIETSLQESNYRISEIVGRLNTMRISNDIAIKKLANDTLVSVAEAFKLQKEGEKFVADARTINAIRDYVVTAAMNESGILSNELGLSDFRTSMVLSPENVEKSKSAYGIGLDIESDRTHRYIREIEEGLGNVFHVSGGSYNYYGSGDYRHNTVPHNSKQATFKTKTPWGTPQTNVWTNFE